MILFRQVSPILASIVALAFAGQACADAGLPPPQLDLNFLFKKLDEYPNYDFYLKYERSFPGQKNGKPNLDKVSPEMPIRLGGRRSGLSAVFLVAVPRGQAPFVPEKHDPDWLRNAPADGLQSPALKGDADGATLEAYSGYDITYRVRLEGNRLEVDWVEANLNSWWSTARLIAILIGAACVLIPIAIVVVIVLVIVRLTRRPPSPASDAP